MSLKFISFLNIIVRIHINTNTALRTVISANVCKGFNIVLTTAFHTSIGTHVCVLVLYLQF